MTPKQYMYYINEIVLLKIKQMIDIDIINQ